MRQMGSEAGEELGPEFDEVVGRLEAGQTPEDIEKELPDLGAVNPQCLVWEEMVSNQGFIAFSSSWKEVIQDIRLMNSAREVLQCVDSVQQILRGLYRRHHLENLHRRHKKAKYA